MQVYDFFTGTPLIKENVELPPPGEYLSRISDSSMAIIRPFQGHEDTCMVVVYELINVETFKHYSFVETYCPYSSSPRGDKFFSYLKKCFPIPYGEDEAIIGTREKVKIGWDILGGWAYPAISHRQLIALPKSYIENYLTEDEDEDEDE